MRHPGEGTLRRLVDDPAGVPDADREHVAGCQECLSEFTAARGDASLAAAALDAEPAADADAAWRRLSHAVESGERRDAAGPRTWRWRAALRSPVVAGVGVATILLSSAGLAAAMDWLPIFRTERIAPFAVSEADVVSLPDLSSYGSVEVIGEPNVRRVASAAAAGEATGLPVPLAAELPAGVTGQPTYLVGDRASVVFTFSAERAASAAAAAGETLPAPPPGLDGARFRLEAGPGIAAVWSESRGLPALAVARAVAPTASSSGIPFETARDYLLSLPGLPDHVAAQLRRFTGDATTLPLPVPAELVKTATADVNGIPATVLTSRDGVFAGVVWVQDGLVTGVAGSLSPGEVVEVARGLRYR